MRDSNADCDQKSLRISRRQLLATSGVAVTGGIAGCSGSGGDGEPTGTGGAPPADGTAGGPSPTPTPEPMTPAPSAAVTPADCEPETISSAIESDTTWTTADCARLALDGNIQVTNGATLTIEPGVEVVGKPNSKLTVKSESTLIANGGSEPVVFYGESMVPGYWRGIDIQSGTENELTLAVVRDAGKNDWAGVLVRDGARLSINSSTFANSKTWGLVAESDATIPTFTNNTFTQNKAPAKVATTLVGALDGASTYAAGNENNRIDVPSATVESEATWPATDAPFLFRGNHQLTAPVTVDPGGQFTFDQNGKLTVKPGGALTAKGSDGNQSRFTGATQTPGFWRGIDIQSNNPDNVLAHAVVAHAGRNGWANILVRDGSRATVTNSTLRDSATWGIVVEEGATFEGSNNTYKNNAKGGIQNNN